MNLGRALDLSTLPARLTVGGLFVLAGGLKLSDVQSFAFAIKGFKVIPADTGAHLIVSAAYTLPWIEIFAGTLLILGLWSRPAAYLLLAQLAVFTAALLSVIARPSVHADCSCFGDIQWPCGGEVGWCQVIRNIGLIAITLVVAFRGGGAISLDSCCSKTPGLDSDHRDA